MEFEVYGQRVKVDFQATTNLEDYATDEFLGYETFKYGGDVYYDVIASCDEEVDDPHRDGHNIVVVKLEAFTPKLREKHRCICYFDGEEIIVDKGMIFVPYAEKKDPKHRVDAKTIESHIGHGGMYLTLASSKQPTTGIKVRMLSKDKGVFQGQMIDIPDYSMVSDMTCVQCDCEEARKIRKEREQAARKKQ